MALIRIEFSTMNDYPINVAVIQASKYLIYKGEAVGD
jgi:hypothetical protein